jgi:hypothetical protein
LSGCHTGRSWIVVDLSGGQPAPAREDEHVRIAVAGGTGVVGEHVVAVAAAAGHEPVVLARSCGVDVTTGQGLKPALAGATAVIDVSNVVTRGSAWCSG